jgi:hypothetical protein
LAKHDADLVKQGPRQVMFDQQPAKLQLKHSLPPRLVAILERLHTHFKYLEQQIAELDKEIAYQLTDDNLGRHLLTISGVGPITASVLTAEMGDGKQYARSRDFAASHAMKRIARALGSDDAPQGAFDFARGLGAPTALKDIGMKEVDIEMALETALRNPYLNPRPVERAPLRALLEAAFIGQRPA